MPCQVYKKIQRPKVEPKGKQCHYSRNIHEMDFPYTIKGTLAVRESETLCSAISN